MKKSALYGGILIAVAIIVVIGLKTTTGGASDTPGKYDDFAKCLSEKEARMYGAYWCSACKAQKEKFGKSFQHVNYIECSLPNKQGQTPTCNQAGISSYPTWEFADGSRLTGVLSVDKLAEITGCEV